MLFFVNFVEFILNFKNFTVYVIIKQQFKVYGKCIDHVTLPLLLFNLNG